MELLGQISDITEQVEYKNCQLRLPQSWRISTIPERHPYNGDVAIICFTPFRVNYTSNECTKARKAK